jgi:hypothetical protein
MPEPARSMRAEGFQIDLRSDLKTTRTSSERRRRYSHAGEVPPVELAVVDELG